MVVELTAGWLTGSMALLADGWHMGSHAAALSISAFAYYFARQRRGDRRFTFGTGKVSTLAGYSSALLLAAGALWMLVESISRLFDPVAIRYGEAMLVATLGLVVNLASAWLLGHGGHTHDHGHGHEHRHRSGHDQGHDHQDHNLRAAYMHVLADALTSVLALVALGLGMAFGWAFLDPMMGIVGATLIARWAWILAADSARVLLDAEDHGEVAAGVRSAIESDADTQIADLHLWRVGTAGRGCIVSLVTHRPRPVDGGPGLYRISCYPPTQACGSLPRPALPSSGYRPPDGRSASMPGRSLRQSRRNIEPITSRPSALALGQTSINRDII